MYICQDNFKQKDMGQTKKRVIIIGAGPAGLTAAYELAGKTGWEVVVLEASDMVGGISRTVCHKGNRMDIGGHRFFSKNDDIMRWWERVMPLQGAPSRDDLLLGDNTKALAPDGPDPERDDRVMLLRRRVSRIFYKRHFFDYPISVSFRTFANMGLGSTVKAAFGYLHAMLHKREERSLEDFYINRFGKPLYEMFFEHYTEKVWGVHPSRLGADWGSQRVKGLSVLELLKNVLLKPFRSRSLGRKDVETSLIEQFIYPKYGPGQLWETVAADAARQGADIRLGCEVKRVRLQGNRVVGVAYEQDGAEQELACDALMSSMPLKELVEAIEGTDVPGDVRRVASTLPYRDFMTVGLLVDKLKIKNQTKLRTWRDLVPDTWIYIQEPGVRVGRLQVFNNWSPYMVADFENKVWMGLEYFCNEGDAWWQMSDEDFIRFAVDELAQIGIIDRRDVLDAVRIKVKKAYPAYYGSYYELDTVKNFLQGVDNLYCIGRNGQHRYNNMDHSMLTAMEAVNHLTGKTADKGIIWQVNTEEDYHESK